MGILSNFLKRIKFGDVEKLKKNYSKPKNEIKTNKEVKNTQIKADSYKKRFNKTINIDGDYETQIYTYLGVIFKGIKKEEEFYVDVVPNDVELHSRSTGTTTRTDGFTTAVSYKGRVFGTLSTDLNFLKEVAHAGFTFKLKVKKIGMYSAGLPELKAETIHPRYLKDWWNNQKISKEEVPLPPNHIDEIYLNVNNPSIFNGRATGKWEPIKIETSLLPVPSGSKAKPHILIKSNNAEIYEMSARDSSYKTLANYVGENPYKSEYRLYESAYEGSDYYARIRLTYASNNEK